MAKTKFDSLHQATLTDGERGKESLDGLSRLSPSLYIGSNNLEDITVSGYYNCADLAHFRVAVRQITQKPGQSVASIEEHGVVQGNLACPNMFDLDTRNLYFGHNNQSPEHAYIKVGEEPDTPHGPKGNAVKGLPVRLQQVHFRAFHPASQPWDKVEDQVREELNFGESDEYSAFFLVSSPVGPFGTTNSGGPLPGHSQITLDSDFSVQKYCGTVAWTSNKWTLGGDDEADPKVGAEDVARTDFSRRLIIGNTFSVASAYMGQEIHRGFYDSWYGASGDELDPNPRQNVLQLTFDSSSLRVKQGKDGDIEISNAYKFTLGQHYPYNNHIPWYGMAPFANAEGSGSLQVTDHFRIEYHLGMGTAWAPANTMLTDYLLRRPPPVKGHFMRVDSSGLNWVTENFQDAVRIELCKILGTGTGGRAADIVTRVYTDGTGIFYDAVRLTGCQEKSRKIPGAAGIPNSIFLGGHRHTALLSKSRYTKEVIRFTTCEDLEAVTSSSTSSSSSSSKSSSSSSSSNSSSSSSSSNSSSSSSSSSSFGTGDKDCPREYCPGFEPEEE